MFGVLITEHSITCRPCLNQRRSLIRGALANAEFEMTDDDDYLPSFSAPSTEVEYQDEAVDGSPLHMPLSVTWTRKRMPWRQAHLRLELPDNAPRCLPELLFNTHLEYFVNDHLLCRFDWSVSHKALTLAVDNKLHRGAWMAGRQVAEVPLFDQRLLDSSSYLFEVPDHLSCRAEIMISFIPWSQIVTRRLHEKVIVSASIIYREPDPQDGDWMCDKANI